MKIRLFCCNTQTMLVPQGKHRNETSKQLVRGGILIAPQEAKVERSNLHNTRVGIAAISCPYAVYL